MDLINAKNPHKVILVGDTAVGKSSILNQFYLSTFTERTDSTIGASYVTKMVPTSQGAIALHIWDTAGQERFKSVLPMYIRSSHAVILVCSVDSPTSVLSLQNWDDLIHDVLGDFTNIYITLNKIDLDAQFDSSSVEKWALGQGYKFFKTSAKDNSTIKALFGDVAENLTNVDPVFAQPDLFLISDKEDKNDNKNECC